MNLRHTKELPIYLTLKEVAELLKVKPRTIYAWVRTREFLTSAKVVCCVFVSMQFSPGMSRFDRANKQHPTAARQKCARARMRPLL
jgi:hypothetical protein